MTRTIWLRFGCLLALIGMLAACGGAGAPAAGPAPTAAPTRREPTSPLVATAPPPTAALPSREPTSQAETPEAPAPITPAAEATSAVEGGIPQGLTAEGYHVLGRPDAPVTLITYSDFL